MLASAYFAAAPSMFLLTTLYLQHGLGLAPVFAGMVSIGFALTSAVSSWIGGNLVNRLGRPLVVWGLAMVLVGIGLLVLAALYTPPEVTPWAMAGAMVIAGFGGGLVISPNQTLALADIPVKQGGLAGSVGQLGQRIGTAVGTAVALSLFYATIYRETGAADTQDLAVYQDAYGVRDDGGGALHRDRLRRGTARPRRAEAPEAVARLSDRRRPPRISGWRGSVARSSFA